MDMHFIDSLVLLDVPDAALLVAEPLGGAVPAELLDELPRPAGDVSREVDGVDALRGEEHFGKDTSIMFHLGLAMWDDIILM